MLAEIGRGTFKGAKIGILAGLFLAALYIGIGALATTEFNKSLGFTLLLVGSSPHSSQWYPRFSGWGFKAARMRGSRYFC